MSREIKFRIWSYIRYKKSYGFVYSIGLIANDETLETDEIMQFIGLKDMNGQDIYEGDILKSEYIPSYFGIEWNNEASCYDWYVVAKTKKLAASLAKSIEDAPKKTGKHFFEIIEVIGNIYENPDLLS